MNAELPVPDSAMAEMFAIESDWEDDDDLRGGIRAIAAPVVAAELRRLADELDRVKDEMREIDNRSVRSSGLGEGIARLRARADELDGGTR